jgi:hypothetical protein
MKTQPNQIYVNYSHDVELEWTKIKKSKLKVKALAGLWLWFVV